MSDIKKWWPYYNAIGEEVKLQTEEDKIAAAVDPKHYYIIPPEAYERFPEGLQYQHLMYYILEGHEPRVSNLLAQVYKYLMRAGSKDDIEQELKKARWYLDFLIEETLPYVKSHYTGPDPCEEEIVQDV